MTLLDLLRDLARSAQEVAQETAEHARTKYLGDFDEDGNPKTIKVSPSPEAEAADVPMSSLKNQSIVVPSSIEMTLDTDVSLVDKPRTDEFPSHIEIHLKRRRRLFSSYSRLKVKATFREIGPPEGVALIQELLDERLRHTVHRSAVTAPLETLTEVVEEDSK